MFLFTLTSGRMVVESRFPILMWKSPSRILAVMWEGANSPYTPSDWETGVEIVSVAWIVPNWVHLPHSCVGGESLLGQRAVDDCPDLWQLLFRRRSQEHGLGGTDAVELAQELANRQYATIFRGVKCLGQVLLLSLILASHRSSLTLSTVSLPCHFEDTL